MRSVGALEAKNQLGELLDCVERGEEIEITREGRPIARLVRANQIPEDDALAAELDHIVAESRRLGARASIDEILDWRDKGRP